MFNGVMNKIHEQGSNSIIASLHSIYINAFRKSMSQFL